MNKEDIINKVKPHLNQTEMDGLWDLINLKDYHLAMEEQTRIVREETLINSNRIKNLTWVGGIILGLLVIASVFLGVKSAMVLEKAEELAARPNMGTPVTYAHDDRADKLDAAGIRWSVNQYPDKTCIVIDAANEPQWQPGTNYSTITLKVMPKVLPPPTKQLE